MILVNAKALAQSTVYAPQEGDMFIKDGKQLTIDYVVDGWCCYRVTDGQGGLLKTAKCLCQDFIRLVNEEEAVRV